MTRWTVNQRIATGFGLLLLLVALVGWVGYNTLQRTVAAFEEALAAQDEAADATNALHAFDEANLYFARYLLRPRDEWLTGRDRALQEARTAFQELRQTDREDAALWAQMLVEVEGYDRASAAAVELMREGQREAAISLREESALPISTRVRQAVRAKVEESRAQSTNTVADVRRTTQSDHWIILGSTLLALVVGFVSGGFLARAITGPLRAASATLAANAQQLVAASAQQASGAAQTTAAVAETASSVDEVAHTADQALERARSMADAAEHATQISREGRDTVEQSMASMQQVRQQVETIATSILALAEQAQAISEIIASVDEIAGQTHLLALNAAIEASRAGEAGRGFSVVASEIRALAEQSRQATVQVRGILGQIQRATGSAVMTTEEGTKQVAAGSRQMAGAGETIRSLDQTITGAATIAAQISASASQQAIGMGQIRQAIRQIEDASHQNLTATRDTERIARDLRELGDSLLQLVGSNGVGLRRA